VSKRIATPWPISGYGVGLRRVGVIERRFELLLPGEVPRPSAPCQAYIDSNDPGRAAGEVPYQGVRVAACGVTDETIRFSRPTAR